MATPGEGGWRPIVASALDWEQAHASFDAAVDGLPAGLRGTRPRDFPHSVWELAEHIRLTQRDLLDFMTDSSYQAPDWPKDYWPMPNSTPTEIEWTKSIDAYHRDRQTLADFTVNASRDLTQPIPPPRGTGQTYLRTVLVAVDHTAYHVGQIIAVRRLLGAWEPAR